MLTNADVSKLERSAHRANIRQLCSRLAREAGVRPEFMQHVLSVLNVGRSGDDLAIRAKLAALQKNCGHWFY